MLSDLITRTQQYGKLHQEENPHFLLVFLLFLAWNYRHSDMLVCNRSKVKEQQQQWKLPREINNMLPLIAGGTRQTTQTSSAVKLQIIRDHKLDQKLPFSKNYAPDSFQKN